ncbi:MAG: sulfur carrier protein ThiS [Rhodospirillales bacterium]|jgi:thiazole synthase|nr:sulfur carrier protein ThiS [Rhodospirillales bacterium]MBT4039511.1 sulfur carrier protein ThiS [Rhodospirillales bacterium]MBT4626753.1 sulfur carrier protein ThiS [Rhodospirillales bacterium]MBT5352865.1 sulfur carrier protein ThiS [Rhodospirillales bacterium]MBT5520258.1 sulfur carrier protein ThiS [Rhodospirillales bacterium]
MQITVNGEERRFDGALTVNELLTEIGLDGKKVAIERNLEIVPKSLYDGTRLTNGDKLEIVHFIGGGAPDDSIQAGNDPLIVAGRTFNSRLIIGTGKFKDYEENWQALQASGADMVTVAVRRVNLSDPDQPMLTDFIDPKAVTYLPNTAGCFTADDALRTLRLAREAGGWDLVKLEILGDEKTLYPRMPETLESLKVLVKEGFQVMVYCSDDPIMCQRLEEEGAAAIMPLGSLIGSGHGIQNPFNIGLIVEQSSVPVIVDAGIGTASEAAFAMELGCDGVIVNTAIAHAADPIAMASAMKHAVIAGRQAYQAGRMSRKQYADASSPLTGLI